MTTFVLEDAKREQARARIGMSGPSGSGKTYSALLLARGLAQGLLDAGKIQTLAGSIGVIDTERRSASLYAHLVPFRVINLAPPYSVDRYVGAMDAIEAAGCSVLLIDQISHAWAGPGGILEYVDELKAQMRNNFAPWKKATPEQHRFVDRMLRSECHLIATMRSRTEWVLEANDKGKQEPRKVGLSPVQRDGIEYEFTTMLDLENEGNTSTVTKDRSGVFSGRVRRIDEQAGRELVTWLLEGEPESAPAPRGTPAASPGGGAGVEYDAKRADLNAAVEQRADALYLQLGMEPKRAAEGIRATLRAAVKLEKGGRPTLAQVNEMLRLAPNATPATED